MRKNVSAKMKVLLAMTAAIMLVASALCGCGGGGGAAGPAASKLEYFSENDSIPVPSSVVMVNEKMHSTRTTNGVTGPTEYTYTLAKDADYTIEEAAQTYIEVLSDEGLEVSGSGDNQWNIANGDSVVATLSVSGDNLKVSLIPESQQTTFKSVSLGEQIEGPDYTFTLTSVDWVKELYPSDRSGGYNYYPEQPNKTYCVVYGTFKYTGGNSFSFKNTSVNFSFNDKYNFSGSAEYEEYNAVGYAQLNDFYSLEPFDEVKIALYASVADEVRNDLQSGVMTWKFTGNGSEYRLEFA